VNEEIGVEVGAIPFLVILFQINYIVALQWVVIHLALRAMERELKT
jgi:hypothetical protein